MSGEIEQRDVYYSGLVQGVGFRFTAQQIAHSYSVQGFVQNLPDGRVRLVVEGTRRELDRLLAEIEQRMRGYIRQTRFTTGPASGAFRDFSIRR